VKFFEKKMKWGDFSVKRKCVPKLVKVQCLRLWVNEKEVIREQTWMKIGEPSSKKKYDKLTDSEQVLWRKDERETYKGVKRFEIQKVEIT